MRLYSPFCLEEELGLSFLVKDALLSEITSLQLKRQFANNNFNATRKTFAIQSGLSALS